MGKFVKLVTVSGLLKVAAIHVIWAKGSAYPFETREELATTVVGSSDMPDADACHTVAGLATAGAVIAAAKPRNGFIRFAKKSVAAVLLTRGIAGGRKATEWLGLPTPSQEFLDADTYLYRPLCIILGLGVLSTAHGHNSHGDSEHHKHHGHTHKSRCGSSRGRNQTSRFKD